MPDSGETPQDVWEACVRHSDLVFWIHDQVWYQRDRRMDAYRSLELAVPTADALTRTLVALRWYALSNDAAVGAGRYLTGDDLAWVPLEDIRARMRRPVHELFAGLEAVALGPAEGHWVNVLRLFSYDQEGRGPFFLARISGVFTTVVQRLVDRYRNPGLNVRDLRVFAWDYPPR
ncbi:hypothetical protein OG552_33630 [Streptomyces sp. NBC_01476]|uniref:hypothetical protein n=1 Tax=Streptomyces sp. NBC_01476 TaxID=2903881 RepID=UPI002E33F719|nr:hypothetical protein [Streptomyces sp. NBC_01476]